MSSDFPRIRASKRPCFGRWKFTLAGAAFVSEDPWFTLASTSGLKVNSQMRAFAKDSGITVVEVFGMATLPLAMTIGRLTNGILR